MSENTVIIDLTDYKDRMGERVPPNTYTVVVSDAELDESRAGNAMVNLWFEIIEGEQKDATIVDRLTMTPKALFRVVNFMRAVGMPTPKKKQAIPVRAFVGKILEVDVDDGEPYNNNIRSEVRAYKKSPLNTAKSTDKADDLEDIVADEPVADASAAEPVAKVEAEWAPAEGGEEAIDMDQLPDF